jgi:hypothetical protein
VRATSFSEHAARGDGHRRDGWSSDPTVTTAAEWRQRFERPARESWHAALLWTPAYGVWRLGASVGAARRRASSDSPPPPAAVPPSDNLTLAPGAGVAGGAPATRAPALVVSARLTWVMHGGPGSARARFPTPDAAVTVARHPSPAATGTARHRAGAPLTSVHQRQRREHLLGGAGTPPSTPPRGRRRSRRPSCRPGAPRGRARWRGRGRLGAAGAVARRASPRVSGRVGDRARVGHAVDPPHEGGAALGRDRTAGVLHGDAHARAATRVVATRRVASGWAAYTQLETRVMSACAAWWWSASAAPHGVSRTVTRTRRSAASGVTASTAACATSPGLVGRSVTATAPRGCAPGRAGR